MSLYIGNTQIGNLLVGTQPADALPEYEGSYLVTPTMTSQTLETENKVLTQDLVVDPMPWTWMGVHTEHLGQIYSADYTLADTSFATWTPSTTAKDIIATVTAGTFVADLDTYEYFIRWRYDYTAALQTGATLKVQTSRITGSLLQLINRRPYGLANISSATDSYAYCTTLVSAAWYNFYYNTSGTATWTSGQSYGIYPTLTAATFSSTTSATPTVTMKAPKVSARCSSTYFATARASEVDQENSTIKIRGDLFRIDKGCGQIRQSYIDAIYVYNNPL